MDEILNNIKFALISLGCDKNLVDSEVMLGLIADNGGIIINNCAEADIIAVNTCGFKHDASQESVNAIIDAVQFKRTGACKTVIVTGCLSERYKDEIFTEIDGVDAIIGANKHGELVNIIHRVYNEKTRVSVYGNDEPCSYGRRVISTKHYAYLKIAEGCDNRCTYCSIPSIRGGYRSRSMDSLVAEAEEITLNGIKEIILVAQDTTLYGTDTCGEPKLAELLRRLSRIGGIQRLRLLYCYPEHITDCLIDEMVANPKIAHYIDMPVQHASDAILRRMGRGKANSADIKLLINKLRARMPRITIRTTVITGFPGETETDFNILLEFIREIKFNRLGVFAYSREDGTPADKLKGHLPEKVKERRKNEVLALQRKISRQQLAERIGTEMAVLVEGRDNDGLCFGRGEGDAPDIDGLVYIDDGETCAEGDFINVMITGATEYDLRGTPRKGGDEA